MTYTYLASPYSHPNLDTMIQRHDAAEAAVHWLLRHRIWTYSPIVHCHALAMKYRLPKEFDFWHEYNCAMLKNSSRMLILTLDGWDRSNGIATERDFCTLHKIPINFISPRPFKIQAKPQGATP